MKSVVTIEDKRAFLKQFVEDNMMKRQECTWILNYILSTDDILENVKFVNDAEYSIRGMQMSTLNSPAVSFEYYLEDNSFNNIEKAFHNIRVQKEDILYIQLNFPSSDVCPYYACVVESNPHISNGMYLSEDGVTDETEWLINEIVQYTSISNLKIEIDKALDSNNQELFMRLTEELNELSRLSRV